MSTEKEAIADRSDLTTIMDYLRLDDRIGSAGQPTPAQLGALGRNGFEVVINLRPEQDSLPDERRIVEEQGIEYIPIGVEWEAPTVENVEAFFSAMQSCADKTVFVHCAQYACFGVLVPLSGQAAARGERNCCA